VYRVSGIHISMAILEARMRAPKKLKLVLPYDPAIPFEGIY
jgi:hypothetical protein